MSWLRKRFRALDVPEEIKLPRPDDYKNLNLGDIKSFRIDSGYILEAIFIDEEKSWAMQLVEPDLGPNPGRSSQMRQPAPGRMFFTNIGLTMKKNTVEMGINIQVSELENEEIPCEVFRIGAVKRLVRNPKIGLDLELKYRIIEKPYLIETLNDIGKLNNLIKAEERQLPVVLISEAEDLADSMMGYAYTFNLPYSFYNEYISNCDSSLEAGDVCVYYSSVFGGDSRKYSYSDIYNNKDVIVKMLESSV